VRLVNSFFVRDFRPIFSIVDIWALKIDLKDSFHPIKYQTRTNDA